MKQNFYFKFVFLSLLMMVMGVRAFADTSTLTFTEKCNGSGTANDGTVWTVTSDGSESNFENSRGIHYGTNNAAVSHITLTTSDIPGTITSVVVNASTASGVTAAVDVKVGGSAFGGEAQSISASATDYTFTGSASGEIVVSVKKPSKATKALYVRSITVTYSTETPTGEKDPQNSFAVEEDNATVGVAYTMPTFTTSSDGEKSYSSSETDIATINSNGEITPLKFGTTTITVTTARTATFASGSASYTLHVAKGTPVLSFAQETVTAYLRTDQNGPKLTNPSDGAVTYEISDPTIATIQSNGYIQPKAAGTATVSATTAETDAWLSATASYTLKVEETFHVDAEGTYEWVKDASTLAAGDELVIVYQANDMFADVMGNQQTNNFKEVSVRFPNDVTDRSVINISSDEATNVAPMMLEGSEEAWYFHMNNGYLYAASSSSNYLRTGKLEDSKVGDNAKASIAIAENGNATVKFLGSNTRNIIRYNSTSSLFSCYASGQDPIQIYRKIDTETPPTVTFSPESGTEVNYGTQVTISARTAKSITYSVNDGEAVTVEGTSATVTINTHSTIKATATNLYGTSEETTAEYTIHAESPAFTYDPAEYTITFGDEFKAPELG